MGDNPIPPWFISVTNPLPATGGRDLESRDHARRFAPTTFQNLLVAVTEADYRAVAQDFTDAHGQKPIQRANASFRWTGSWLTVTLAVDPRGTQGLSVELRNALLAFLDTRRLAGYDLEVRRAIYVPIDLVIEFCPAKGFFAPDVQKRLLQALSNGDLPGGRKGFFHPDNFSFGDNLYVSQLYAAIMAVAGVESAQITQLTRARAARPAIQTAANLRQGYLSIGLDEIIQLDNDRNFPQRGTLTIRPKGGR
jgi:predicted phage baseplate assembly protein